MSMPLARRVPRPSTGSGRAPAVRLARSVVIGVIIPEGPGRVPRWVRQGQRRATTGGRPYGEGLWLRPALGFAAPFDRLSPRRGASRGRTGGAGAGGGGGGRRG